MKTYALFGVLALGFLFAGAVAASGSRGGGGEDLNEPTSCQWTGNWQGTFGFACYNQHDNACEEFISNPSECQGQLRSLLTENFAIIGE